MSSTKWLTATALAKLMKSYISTHYVQYRLKTEKFDDTTCYEWTITAVM